MLKSIRALILSGLVVLLCVGGASAEVTGKQWSSSTNNEKLAFLYGASSIVAIETVAGEKTNDKPSIFVQKWIETFGKDDVQALCDKINGWYAKNPNQQDRNVFDVMWYEFMAPGTKK